jgi:hypothetical protein
MTLTNTQISQIRLLATDDNTPFLVNSEAIDILYTQAGSDMNTAVYNVMALMKMRLAATVPMKDDKRHRDVLNARIDALCERMKYYETQYGIGSTMTVGTMDLGIDTDLSETDVSAFNTFGWW